MSAEIHSGIQEACVRLETAQALGLLAGPGRCVTACSQMALLHPGVNFEGTGAAPRHLPTEMQARRHAWVGSTSPGAEMTRHTACSSTAPFPGTGCNSGGSESFIEVFLGDGGLNTQPARPRPFPGFSLHTPGLCQPAQ